ncbi:MAG: YfbM family protein [Gammaproteobacteria bacterium]
MSIHLHLTSISDANIERLNATPSLIWTIVSAEQCQTSAGEAVLTRRGLYREPIYLRESLGKYWHGIHYLLCGEVWNGEFPASFLIDGGSYVGDIDIGYGMARTFEAAEVRSIARYLNKTHPADLAQHFDACRMLDADVYPALHWDQEPQALNYCLERFQAMQHFVRHTVENGLGMALYLQETQPS